MIRRKKFEPAFYTTLLISSFAASAVYAAPRGTDYFSVTMPHNSSNTSNSNSSKNTSSAMPGDNQAKPPGSAGALSMMSDRTPVVTWFEKFDQLKEQYRPTPGDRVILSRPLMQEEERVKQWSATAAKISKNYIRFAKELKNLPVPGQLSDLKQYRDLTADWYQDSAAVFDDLIRPRRPAKTIEELQGQLNDIKSRSATLANTIASLNNMDQSLRKEYKVHLAIQDDALQQYVRGK